MNKTITALSVASLFFLTACSDPTTIEANKGQIGAGTTITYSSGSGTLNAMPTPSSPHGLQESLAGPEIARSPGGDLLTFTRAGNAKLQFINVGDAYICKDCMYYNLPLTWHRKRG